MKLKSADIRKILTSLLAFVLFVILLVGELSYIMNIFNFYTVLIIVVLVGLLVGLGLAFYLKRYTEELITQFQIFVSMIVLSVVIVPLLISFSNRFYTQPLDEKFIFVDSEEVYGLIAKGSVPKGEAPPPTGYMITLERPNGKRETVRVDRNIAEGLKAGDSLELLVCRGLYGIVFVPPQ